MTNLYKNSVYHVIDAVQEEEAMEVQEGEERVIAGSEPKICKWCGKKFATVSNARRHEREAHGIPNGAHICHICHKEFISFRLLTQHITVMHKSGVAILSKNLK